MTQADILPENSRSLLGIMGLEKRIFNGNLKNEITDDIDYATVGEKLNALRAESIEFFKNALEVKKENFCRCEDHVEWEKI